MGGVSSSEKNQSRKGYIGHQGLRDMQHMKRHWGGVNPDRRIGYYEMTRKPRAGLARTWQEGGVSWGGTLSAGGGAERPTRIHHNQGGGSTKEAFYFPGAGT